MPKIGKRNISFYNTNQRLFFEVTMMYSTKLNFYINVPAEYNVVFDHLSESERKHFNSRSWDKHSWQDGGEKTRIVSTSTEADTIESMTNLLKHLVTLGVKTRNVIIVFYNGDTGELDKDNHYINQGRNREHQPLSLHLSLAYCEEVSIGAIKSYNIKTIDTDPFERGKNRTIRHSVSLSREQCVIIDDTPRNREALEDLYSKLQQLVIKLHSITAAADKLLEYVTLNQKFLN